jgi:transglutaminase-like putative cysteine protease
MTATYRVTHRTEYEYDEDVTLSYGQLHLLPRDAGPPTHQRCLSSEITVEPRPEVLRERHDYYGNRVSYFEIQAPHRRLTVTAESVVEVGERAAGISLLGNRRWEDARDAPGAGLPADHLDAADFTLDSPLVPDVERYRAYAQESFTAGRPLLDAIASLTNRIYTEFEYVPGSTSVTTPLADVFRKRKGVCQDFAHLGIACLRSLGLSARYVSGYLETDAPTGKPKLTGVDGSHAWLSVLIPEASWLDVDPTNDQFAGDRYVVTAYGRDYSDVPPLNGVIYTEGKSNKLTVAVDVVAVTG